MCNILKTANHRAKGTKFGTRIPMYCICRVFFMSDSLISVWASFGTFAKYPMLKFSKGYCSHGFHSISTELYCKYVGHD